MAFSCFLLSLTLVICIYFMLPLYKEKLLAASIGVIFSFIIFAIFNLKLESMNSDFLNNHVILINFLIPIFTYITLTILRFSSKIWADLIETIIDILN